MTMSGGSVNDHRQLETPINSAKQGVYGRYFADQSTTSIGGWIKNHARQRQLAVIESFIPDTGKAILEIGPGFGELTQLFLAAGHDNYTVIEPNMAMRERLAAWDVKTRDYLIPDLRETDESFDVIVLFDVFEHLNGTPEAQRFAAEAHRVLRPEGIICILSPDYLHWRYDFFNGDYSHSNITTVRRTLQLLHDHGFVVLEQAYFSGFFRGASATLVSYIFRLGLWFSVGNKIDSKLYKLKTTFLRSFLVIGAKPKRL
jgi:SAM-dependent methyltransferase